MVVPVAAWWLNVSLVEALLLDLGIVLFFLPYVLLQPRRRAARPLDGTPGRDARQVEESDGRRPVEPGGAVAAARQRAAASSHTPQATATVPYTA